MGSERKYWIGLALLVVAFGAYEALRPRPLDWTPTLAPGDTRPYGAEVLRRLLPGLAGGPVEMSSSPLRTLLEARPRSLFVLAHQASLSLPDVARLLQFVEGGGTVLVVTHELPRPLADTLGLNSYRGLGFQTPFTPDADTARLAFVAPGLRDTLRVSDRLLPALLGDADADTTRWDAQPVLVAKRLPRDPDDDAAFRRAAPRPVALVYTRGAGRLVVSDAPLLLSNYGLLDAEGAAFARRLFAYLPPGRVVWWRRASGEAISPLRYILRQDSLRWAFYTALAALLLFGLVAARRRERPVPTTAPLANDTADFVRTMGLLYYHRGDHANLAAKLEKQFHAYARDTLNMTQTPADADFAAQVAHRSGVPRAQVEALIAHFARVAAGGAVSQQALLDLGRAANQFYAASSRPPHLSA